MRQPVVRETRRVADNGRSATVKFQPPPETTEPAMPVVVPVTDIENPPRGDTAGDQYMIGELAKEALAVLPRILSSLSRS